MIMLRTIGFATLSLAMAATAIAQTEGMSGMSGAVAAADDAEQSRYVKQKVVYQINGYGAKEQTAAADIVPSGVAELAHLQIQGYTYIKP